MSILREAYSSGSEPGIDERHMAAAVFELAEQGALTIAYGKDCVRLAKRSQPVNTLSREQRELHSRIFRRKETVELSTRQTGELQHISLAAFNRLIQELEQGKRQRLIATLRWRVVIGLLATGGIAVVALSTSLSPLIGALLGAVFAGSAVGSTVYATVKTEQVVQPQRGRTPLDESVVSFLLWEYGADREQALLLSELDDWAADPDVRRPTWWEGGGNWPQDHGQKLLHTYHIVLQAFTA